MMMEYKYSGWIKEIKKMDKEAQQLIAIGVMIFFILLGLGGCGSLMKLKMEFDSPTTPTKHDG